MIKHLKYLFYLLKHKYYVFIECWKLGIPIRGLLHDLSKFHPVEWFSYADRFFSDSYDEDDFANAWLHHWLHNDHHWQYWCREGWGSEEEMSINALLELLADWRAMGRTQGNNAKVYYEQNKRKINLHPKTRSILESLLFQR